MLRTACVHRVTVKFIPILIAKADKRILSRPRKGVDKRTEQVIFILRRCTYVILPGL